jgi:choline dehydrogenase-like flavoprotein
MASDTFDYIVVGGGIAGTVIASRLHERKPALKILLIEAGPDSHKTALAEITANPTKVGQLKGSELDWDYTTVPQPGLDNREIYAGAGKALGGSSVINYGVWTRGHSVDYDTWASIVDSPRFSWKGMLPYFNKTETHFDSSASERVHGHHGPILTASVSSSGRNYILREPLRDAWAEIGITQPKDINDGSPLGMAEMVEARTKGKRVIAAAAYLLEGITILSSTIAKRVVFTTKNGKAIATGVELADGQTYHCTNEVILSAGAFRTPQLLLLSGIGPASELSKHGIPQVVESPDVGKNLWDHLGAIQQWKLTPKYSALASSAGSPLWTDPKFETGNAMDYYTTSSVPYPGLRTALEKDSASDFVMDSLTKTERCHVAFIVQYFGLPVDGTSIMTYILNGIPTSRGTVSLRSADVNEKPVIDNHHFETEADRYRLRTAIRMMLKMLNTKAGKEMVVGEVLPDGVKAVGEESSDEEIDKRIKDAAQ